MIHYALACDSGHSFESWFPSSTAYDDQVARGLVACPVCDSKRVGKGVMAPAVARRDLKPAAPQPPGAAQAGPDAGASPASQTASAPGLPAMPAPRPMALLSEPERQLRAMLRAVRDHVVANSEHVGNRFATEARRMHEGEIEQRSIYGEATPDDARALLEDGIEVHPLPVLPDDRN